MNHKTPLILMVILIFLVSPAVASTSIVVKPVASFTAVPSTGYSPLVVFFTDHSTGKISNYKWNFGDGKTSSNSNPNHLYLTPGNYTVTETVSNSAGSSTVKKQINIPKMAAAVAHPRCYFKAVQTKGAAPLTVQFLDQSIRKPTAWLWTFGDGSFSRVQNPIHVYKKAGKYSVRLQIWNAKGACSSRYVNYITVT